MMWRSGIMPRAWSQPLRVGRWADPPDCPGTGWCGRIFRGCIL